MTDNSKRRRAWEAEQIAKASYYTAVMFFGRGRYDKRRAETLEEARQVRREMLAEYAGTNCGRGVMIYAVTRYDAITIHVE